MTLNELKGVAQALNVPNVEHLNTDRQLVRAIQAARGEACCFLTDARAFCWSSTCEWRSSCLRLIAEWHR